MSLTQRPRQNPARPNFRTLFPSSAGTLRHRVKVAVAAATTALLAIGVVAIGAAAPASAHTATLTAQVACTTSTGAAVVTWTISNDYKEKVRVTQSDNTVMPVGTTVQAAGATPVSQNFVQNVSAPAAGKTISATLAFIWEGDSFEQAARTVSVTVNKDCTAPTPVTPKTYTTVAWKMPSWVNSTTATFPQDFVIQKAGQTSTLHALDALNGSLPTTCGTQYQIDVYNQSAVTAALIAGKVLTAPNQPREDLIPGGWGVAYKLVKNPDCAVVPTPITTSAGMTAQTCVSNGLVDGTITVALNEHVIYTIDGTVVTSPSTQVAPGAHTVTAGLADSNGSYSLYGPSSWNLVVPAYATQCGLTEVVPAATSTAISCEVAGSYTLENVLGVSYTVNGTVKPAGTYAVKTASTVHVVPSASAGYRLADATKVWDFSFTTPSDCQLTTHPLVTPAASSTPTSCTAGGTYTLTPVNGVDYLVDGSSTPTAPGTYSATAGTVVSVQAKVISTDWGFEAGVPTTWKFTFAQPSDCGQLPTDALTTPTVANVDRTCTVNGSYTLGAAAGVVYTVNGVVQPAGTYPVSSARSVQVKASTVSSEFGFAFDQQTEWNLAFTNPADCGDLKTLAYTGSDGTLAGGLLVGLLFIMTGAGAYTASRIRIRRS